MSTETDLGPLLEALVTCVGVFDGISLLAYIFDRSYHKLTTKKVLKDENNNEIDTTIKSQPTKPHKSVTTCPIPHVIIDGISQESNDDVIDSLRNKVNELETKVAELEVRSRESSVERLLEVERVRRSRSPTPYSRAQLSEDSSSSGERYRRSRSPSPRVKMHLTRNSVADGVEIEIEIESSSIDDESNTTTPSGSQSREESAKRQSKPITRDDEFRKTKRSSQAPHESREDEIAALTRIEREENESMNDFVRIVYEGHEDDVYTSNNIIYLPPVSPIQEDVDDEFDTSIEATSSSPIDTPTPIDINESFIKMERAAMQTSSILPENTSTSSLKNSLTKQEAHVSDEEFEDDKINILPPLSSSFPSMPAAVPVQVIDDINSTQQQIDEKNASLPPPTSTNESATDKNTFAVISMTPTPDVSISMMSSMNMSNLEDAALDSEVSNISSSPNALRRTKRFADSLNQTTLSPTGKWSRGRKSQTPANEEDYKDWFDKFDSHLSPNLTLDEDDEFESEVEEEFLVDDQLSGAEICKIDDDVETRDVSVSVTLNLSSKKKSPSTCSPCAEYQKNRVFKTKAEEFDEIQNHRFRNSEETATRKVSIAPSTDEEQQKYVSVFHPEEFPTKSRSPKKEPRPHHVHLHNVGYSEWMKKLVEHNSSHLALSDSDSDSDVSLDDVKMLPLFCGKKI